MFETLKNKNAKSLNSKHEGYKIVCAACGYVRKESDANPAWKCPSCEAAYVKTDKAHNRYSQVELKQRNAEYQSKEERKIKLSAIKTGIKGMWFGVAAFLSGAGSACSGAASNPFLQAVGAVLVLGSIAYVLIKTLSS